MIRNLKILGLAITAVLAMAAVSGAGAAQAAPPDLVCTPDGNANTCSITGTERIEHVFSVEGGRVRCKSRLAGTMNARSVTTLTLNAEYNECRAFGVAATVNMNGCSYDVDSQETAEPHTANVTVTCPRGASITVRAPSLPCTINVGEQGPLSHIVFRNEGSDPTDVTANITVEGITYTKVENTCPGRSGTFNTGTYNGAVTLEAFNDVSPGVHGNKVGLHILTR